MTVFVRNDTRRVRPATALLLLIMMLVCTGLASAARPSPHQGTTKHQKHHHHRQKILHKAGWAGAGFAAGRAIGPPGSAAVGVTKYRKDLKAGGHRRTRAIAKIGGPIAAGAVAGPSGSVGYEAVEHRHWIKRHILHRRPHG